MESMWPQQNFTLPRVQRAAGPSEKIEQEVIMGSRNRSRVVLAGCVILIAAGCVLGQDWPQWRGPNRDGKVTGFTAPQTWPKELTPKWKTTVGTGDATPALVGDKLYVFARQGDEEVTLCLNAADGKEVWKDKYAAQAVTGAAAAAPGPRSSPAVADGKVVTLGVGGVVSCLDAATGKLVWRKDPFPKVDAAVLHGHVADHRGRHGHRPRRRQGQRGDHRLRPGHGDEKWKWAAKARTMPRPS